MRVLPQGASPRVVAELGDAELAVARALAEAHPDREKTVRAAAEKWVAGVTALLGLFGLSGLVVGKDATAGLGGTATRWLVGLVIVAFVAAMLAILNSYLAAYGWPLEVGVDTKGGQLSWWERRKAGPGRAAKNLRTGVTLAVVAVVALAAAVGVLWFGGTAPAPKVSVTRTDDSKVCGELLGSVAAGSLQVRRADGRVETVNGADLSKMSAVAKCPV